MKTYSFLSWRRVGRLSAIVGLLAASSSPALASEHGCKVLMCLANPNGPKAVVECHEDIDRLFRDLRRGRPFPRCEMGSAPNSTVSMGAAEAVPRYTWHDNCPEGTTSLAAGERAIQGVAPPGGFAFSYVDPATAVTGIGEGSGEVQGEFGGSVSSKPCVGRKVGEIAELGSEGVNAVYSIYDRVVVLDPQSSPNVIDVNIDGQLYRRVRW